MKKLTTEEFKAKIKEKYGDEYIILGTYKNSKTAIECQNKNGFSFFITPNHLLFRGGRSEENKQWKNRGKDTKWFKNKVQSLVGSEYSVLGEYKNSKTKIKIKHEICETIFEMSPEKFISGQRCPACAAKSRQKKNIKMNTEKYKEKVRALVGDEYTVLGEFKGLHKKILMRHNSCNGEYGVYPDNFLFKENRCPFCDHGHRIKTTEEFKKEVFDLVGNEYTVLSEYKGSTKFIKFRHNNCGYIFRMFPNNFLHKHNRCPNCTFKNGSKEEKDILAFIKSIYFGKIEENHRFFNESNRRKFQEIDIFLPDLGIGFEFNGLYWHSEQQGKNKFFHLNKEKFFMNLGIFLYQIFEDEWKNKQDEIKKAIKDKIENKFIFSSEQILVSNSWDGLNTKKFSENNYKLDKIIPPRQWFFKNGNIERLEKPLTKNYNSFWDCGYSIYKKI